MNLLNDLLASLPEDAPVRSVLVGHFPFIPKLRQAAGQLWVIEQRPNKDEYQAEAAVDLIPQADMVAIIGSALIEHGVTILSGARIVDEANALRTIGQGATFQQVEGVKLLTFIHDKEKSYLML